MSVAAASRRTQEGIRRRAYDQKAAMARKAAVDDVARSLARIERIIEQEGIRSQALTLIEQAANRVARRRGDVAAYMLIEKRICRVFKVTPELIRGRGRNSPLVALARQAIMYWAARLTTMSPKQIGKHMGGRDHSTVYFGIDAYPRKRARAGRTLRPVPRLSQFGGLRKRDQ